MKSSNPASPRKPKRKSHPFWQWFWLSFLVLSLAYAWYSFYVPDNDIEWAENMATAQQLASNSDKDILLFFTGSWCVPCRIMKREVFADEEVMQAIQTEVIPVEIDIDKPDSKDLVTRYNIGSTPITIFTDAQGNVHDYAVGKISKDRFLEMLQNIQHHQ